MRDGERGERGEDIPDIIARTPVPVSAPTLDFVSRGSYTKINKDEEDEDEAKHSHSINHQAEETPRSHFS